MRCILFGGGKPGILEELWNLLHHRRCGYGMISVDQKYGQTPLSPVYNGAP